MPEQRGGVGGVADPVSLVVDQGCQGGVKLGVCVAFAEVGREGGIVGVRLLVDQNGVLSVVLFRRTPHCTRGSRTTLSLYLGPTIIPNLVITEHWWIWCQVEYV